MRPFTRLVGSLLGVSLGVAVLSGCATVARQGVDQEAVALAPAVVQPVLPALPNIELDGETLNEVLVAEVALQRGEYGAAVEIYSRLAQQTRDPRLAERAARIAVFSRDYQGGLLMARLWLELVPDDVEGRQILTALQVRGGDFDGAVESLESVLTQAQGDEQGRYLLMIRLLGRDQDKDGALEVVKRFLARHPDDGAALYTHSQLALRAGKLEEAEAAVDHLLRLRPDLTQAVVLRARILQATGREPEALEYLGKVVGRNGKNHELRVAYGRMLVDVDRPAEAQEQFKKVLKAQPDNDDITFAAGLVALRLEQPKEAEAYFLRLNHKSVRVDETSYYLGRIEEVRENYKGAIHWYNQVGNGENYINAQIRSALLQARLGDVDGARAHLGVAQSRSPDQSLRLYMAEGEILRDVGRYDEATELYGRALQELPGNSELLYARAMVLEKTGHLDRMEADLLAILEREPDHADALNSLGYTLADRTDRLQEAEAYVARALELKPESFYIIDSMGWVQYRKGNLEEALKLLRHALSLADDPEIAAHLGEVLWVTGDKEAARATWSHALEQVPDNKLLLETIKRLDK